MTSAHALKGLLFQDVENIKDDINLTLDIIIIAIVVITIIITITPIIIIILIIIVIIIIIIIIIVIIVIIIIIIVNIRVGLALGTGIICINSLRHHSNIICFGLFHGVKSFDIWHLPSSIWMMHCPRERLGSLAEPDIDKICLIFVYLKQTKDYQTGHIV